MSLPILCKINVTKINKSKLFPGKDGAQWLDIVLIPTPDSQYGDFMIVESATREERAAGKRGPILGNGKFATKGSAPRTTGPPNGSGSDGTPPF